MLLVLTLLFIVWLMLNISERFTTETEISDCTCSKMKTLTYTRFKKIYRSDESFVPKRIPRVIFRTGPFHMCKAPYTLLSYLENTVDRNPEYTQVYFDDDDCREFIREYYLEFLPYYDVLIPTAFKADLWRLLVLYKYGGIYNDIGHIYEKPVNALVDETDELVFALDFIKPPEMERVVGYSKPDVFALHNAFFACYPKHELIMAIIEHVVSNIRKRVYGTNPLEITGPIAWGRGLAQAIDLRSKISQGEYKLGGHRVKFVNYYGYEFKDPRNNIAELDGTPVIQTKFPGYYDTMYKNTGNIHYDTLWQMRRVYADDKRTIQ